MWIADELGWKCIKTNYHKLIDFKTNDKVYKTLN